MQAALLLLIAAALMGVAARWPWAAAPALVAAAWAGTTLPDWDMALGLGHRSGLTHSMLPVVAACSRARWRAVAAGLALGIALHLSADLFPNAMRGFATVKLPGAGSIGAESSYWWIAVNAAIGLAAGVWLAFATAPSRLAAAALAAVGLIGIAYLFRTDGGWWALMLFAAAACLAVQGRRRTAQ